MEEGRGREERADFGLPVPTETVTGGNGERVREEMEEDVREEAEAEVSDSKGRMGGFTI